MGTDPGGVSTNLHESREFRSHSWIFVLIRGQQVVGGFSWRGRGARGKGEAESFPLREGSGGHLLVEAVGKPLLLLAGGDGTDATNGTNGTTTKHSNALTQNSPRHLGTAPAGYRTSPDIWAPAGLRGFRQRGVSAGYSSGSAPCRSGAGRASAWPSLSASTRRRSRPLRRASVARFFFA